MKKMLCFVALLAMSFTTLTASAKSSHDEKIKFSSKIENLKTKKVIDFNTFMSNIDYKNIDKKSITFDVEAGTFSYTDTCGNIWTVTYWGMSYAQASAIVQNLNNFLCQFAAALAAMV